MPSKQAVLDRCRTALDEELYTPGFRDRLIDAARAAGASMDEVRAAFAGQPSAN
jgi:hypothetical protein